MFHSIVKGVNDVLPGGGGNRYDAGQGALKQPINGGQSLAPIGSLLAGGLLPTGVVPGAGYVGNDPKITGKDGKSTAPKSAKTSKTAKPAKAARRVRREFIA
jgi:hypothetical protein